MTSHSSHFARVTPIVGHHLRQMRVAVAGLPQADPLVHALAACGVRRWRWATFRRTGSQPAIEAQLLARHGTALGLDTATFAWRRRLAALRADPPDLLLAVGNHEILSAAEKLAHAVHTTALLIWPPTSGATLARLVLPGDPLASDPWPIDDGAAIDTWEWATSALLLAGVARALLLRATPYARSDIARLLHRGIRRIELGGAHPLDCHWHTAAEPLPQPDILFHTPPVRRGRLLIAGLGSLGSEAAALLAPACSHLLLIDPDTVDAANPVRQHYPVAAIGRPKAAALAAQLRHSGAIIHAHASSLHTEAQVATLLADEPIDAALVVTGTAADFAIARALRDHGVPHVVGRCYPRARYWEAIVVDGKKGPAYGDIRGYIQTGPLPQPTAEQLAAYSAAGALESEPATLVESGWAAAWLARLVAQLRVPTGLRERWLLELLAAGQTCLIGGTVVEPTTTGPAYAIAHPGAIHAWGMASLSAERSTIG